MLVFGGGGVRGIAYAGILKELALKHKFDFYSRDRNITHCIGTSIGALFAALVVIGVNVAEMERLVASHDLASSICIDASRFVTALQSWGISSSGPLENWIDKAISQKIGKSDITMLQLYRLTSVKLTVVVTNITDNCAEYWSYETHPEMRVAYAVVASMSLPPLFPPRQIIRTIRRETVKCSKLSNLPLRIGDTVSVASGETGVVAGICGYDAIVDVSRRILCVDGGLRDNFAIRHAAVEKPQSILGLKVNWACANSISTLDRYVARLAYCALSVAEDTVTQSMPAELRSRILSCDVGDISTVDFNLSAEVVIELLNRGARAAQNFIGLTRDASTQTDPIPLLTYDRRDLPVEQEKI